MNERHIKLGHLLKLIESESNPERYQSRQNELAREIARFLIEEREEKAENYGNRFYETQAGVGKKEILHAIGELLSHRLFKILDIHISVYKFEKELVEILTEIRDMKKKMSQLWNIVNIGNPEGRLE